MVLLRRRAEVSQRLVQSLYETAAPRSETRHFLHRVEMAAAATRQRVEGGDHGRRSAGIDEGEIFFQPMNGPGNEYQI
jgi:hypothetical protein